MISEFSVVFLKSVVEIGFERLLSQREKAKIRWAGYRNRSKKIRVSMAVLLSLQDESGLYFLIKNTKKPNLYAPAGGVIRFLDLLPLPLQKVEFTAEAAGKPLGEANDLRGYIKGRNLFQFVEWFFSGVDRETTRQCLVREIIEELGEQGIVVDISQLALVDFHGVRTCIELPFWPPVEDKVWMQFRWLEVVEAHGVASQDVVRTMLLSSLDCIWVTPAEIMNGVSANGSQIAPSAEYLIKEKRSRPEPPHI